MSADRQMEPDREARQDFTRWFVDYPATHARAGETVEVTPTKRGMNTVRDVEETVLRCARAVKQADPDHTVEDFDVIGVVADMVEVYARENETLRSAEKRQCNRADEAEHERDELRAENERLNGWLRENKAEAVKAWTEVERLRKDLGERDDFLYQIGKLSRAYEAGIHLESPLTSDEDGAS